nr:hypothetical protein GCM10020092_054100 [Actinoplanes digitatis]
MTGGKHGVAERLVQHALAVGTARGYETETAHARYVHAAGALHWFQPLEDEVQQARSAREGLLRGGDLHSVCLAYWPSLFALVDTGPTLDHLDAEANAALTFAARTGNDNAAAIQILYRQFVRALRGETGTPGGFSDDTFDEHRHLEVNKRVALHYFTYRALSAVIFDDVEVLVRHTEQAVRLAPMLQACYPYALTQLLQALALARRLRDAEPEQRPALLAALDDCRDFLAERAVDAPENFRHLERLVAAERAWAVDDFRAAATAFDAALRDVEPRQRPWHRALIAERASLFHLEHGLPRAGRGLLAEAREHYRSWGAAGKVRQLERAHPGLPAASSAPARPASGRSVRADDIDLLAVLRASQALSSETDLDRLQASVVEQVGALAGATDIRLALFDTDAGGWVLPDPDRPGDPRCPSRRREPNDWCRCGRCTTSSAPTSRSSSPTPPPTTDSPMTRTWRTCRAVRCSSYPSCSRARCGRGWCWRTGSASTPSPPTGSMPSRCSPRNSPSPSTTPCCTGGWRPGSPSAPAPCRTPTSSSRR